MNTTATEHAAIDAALLRECLTLTATFVPASRFKGDEWRATAVNFEVRITGRNDREVYAGPYAYGVGNLPGYRHDRATKLYWSEYVDDARERGVWPQGGLQTHMPGRPCGSKVPAPKLRDVMYSLISDASVLDAGGFESWAAEYGYDTDSRKAEATYRACLENALKLRAALGDTVLAELRELFADY